MNMWVFSPITQGTHIAVREHFTAKNLYSPEEQKAIGKVEGEWVWVLVPGKLAAGRGAGNEEAEAEGTETAPQGGTGVKDLTLLSTM